MINSTYKIWIIIFGLVNIILFSWSLNFYNFFEDQNLFQDNIIIIKPEQDFIKYPPPKDESFPNEKSEIWNAFENKKNVEEKNIKNNKEKDIAVDNKIKKNEDRKDVKSDLLKKEKVKKNNTIETKKIKSDEKETSIENEKNVSDSINPNRGEEKNNAIVKQIFYVQIASLSKKNLVEKEWQRLKKKYSKNMKGLVYISQEANLKDNRTFHRLLVGKFDDKNMAESFCNDIGIKRNCIIKKIYE